MQLFLVSNACPSFRQRGLIAGGEGLGEGPLETRQQVPEDAPFGLIHDLEPIGPILAAQEVEQDQSFIR